MKVPHIIVYLIEFLVIGLGFILILNLDTSFYNELILFILVLILYNIIGIFHHKSHHDLHPKVVLEYILISALVFALFVFVNIAKI